MEPLTGVTEKLARTEEHIEVLNTEFADLIKSGSIYSCGPLGDEEDHLDLPRLAFHHNRRRFGRLRAMIDCINGFNLTKQPT